MNEIPVLWHQYPPNGAADGNLIVPFLPVPNALGIRISHEKFGKRSLTHGVSDTSIFEEDSKHIFFDVSCDNLRGFLSK